MISKSIFSLSFTQASISLLVLHVSRKDIRFAQTCNVSLTMIGLGYVMILMYAMIGVTVRKVKKTTNKQFLQIYCAISINRAIASDAISAKSKVLHAKSLKMLIAQVYL